MLWISSTELAFTVAFAFAFVHSLSTYFFKKALPPPSLISLITVNQLPHQGTVDQEERLYSPHYNHIIFLDQDPPELPRYAMGRCTYLSLLFSGWIGTLLRTSEGAVSGSQIHNPRHSSPSSPSSPPPSQLPRRRIPRSRSSKVKNFNSPHHNLINSYHRLFLAPARDPITLNPKVAEV